MSKDKKISFGNTNPVPVPVPKKKQKKTKKRTLTTEQFNKMEDKSKVLISSKLGYYVEE